MFGFGKKGKEVNDTEVKKHGIEIMADTLALENNDKLPEINEPKIDGSIKKEKEGKDLVVLTEDEKLIDDTETDIADREIGDASSDDKSELEIFKENLLEKIGKLGPTLTQAEIKQLINSI